jgi:DnaJ-domain-containing protein 1
MAVGEPDAERIVAALSPERFAPYLRRTGGDLHGAVGLYEWNLAVSSAFYEALGILEVVLRNAMSRQLAAHHGALAGQWYDDPLDVLSDLARDDIAAARRRVRKLRRPETPGRVVAELNFGFWKYLLAKRYEATLWTGSLRLAFPNLQPQKRAVVHRALDEMHTVRNRIAHHEAIHCRDLTADMLTIYRLLDWIDRDVCAWAVSLSRLQPIVASQPS